MPLAAVYSDPAIGDWQLQAANVLVGRSKRTKGADGSNISQASPSTSTSMRATRTSRRRSRVTATHVSSPTLPVVASVGVKRQANRNISKQAKIKSEVLVFPPPFQCPNCGRGYQRLQTLKRHLRTECNQPKKFVCKICDRRFHHNFKLDEHYSRVHGLHS